MRFLHVDCLLDRGDVVHVDLRGTECNVFLVDGPNFSAFRRGAGFTYVGGLYRQSPVRLQAPRAGRWTLVIMPPAGGHVEASHHVERYVA